MPNCCVLPHLVYWHVTAEVLLRDVGHSPVISHSVASIEKAKLFITYGMLLGELPCVPLFPLKKHMFGVIVKSFISPFCFTAVANNWRPEPRTGPSAERPAAHRVGTAPLHKRKKKSVRHFCARLSNILLCVCFAGTRTERYDSGMHRESACIPCTSWAPPEFSTRTQTPTITWTKAQKENGRCSGRCGPSSWQQLLAVQLHNV